MTNLYESSLIQIFKQARDETRFCGEMIDATVSDLSKAVIDAAGNMVESVGNLLPVVDKSIEEVEQVEVVELTKPTSDFIHTVEEVVEEADKIEVDDFVGSIGADFKGRG